VGVARDRGEQMSDPVSSPLRRYRRRILGWGLSGVVALCAVAAPLFLRSVERDLEHRVPTELAERGFAGVSAAFSGQDGVLRCAAPLAEPEDAIDAAIDVWGVRAIELDRSCRVTVSPEPPTVSTTSPDDTVAATSPPPPTTTDDEPAPGSIVDVVTSDPQFSILASLIDEADLSEMFGGDEPLTLFAPSDDAFDDESADVLAELRRDADRLVAVVRHHAVSGTLPSDQLVAGPLEMLDGTLSTVTITDDLIAIGDASVTEPDLTASNGVVHVIDQLLLPGSEDRAAIVSATLDGGRVVLGGTVDEAQREVLVGAASRVLDLSNVDDQLVVDAGSVIEDSTVDALAELVAAMPPNLVRGESGFDGDELYAEGVFVDDARRSAFLAVADFLLADVSLDARPTASVDDAEALELALNDLVGANPIQFEPASAEATADAPAVLDQLAGIAKRFDGLTLTVEGHTDSDGVPAENQTLSEERAEAVVAGLVARGVPAADLVAVGLGSTRPILVGATEDKDASRRIEFRVTTTGT
jgi:OOP family OmpA-OmpF porin